MRMKLSCYVIKAEKSKRLNYQKKLQQDKEKVVMLKKTTKKYKYKYEKEVKN